MKNHCYCVETKHGTVKIMAENIEEAREIAKKRFKVRARSAVSRERKYVRCEVCDSKPCVCG